MSEVYENKYGRRMTRGIRPWLLIPKVIAVAMFVGGMGACAALALLGKGSVEGRLEGIGTVVRWVIIPGGAAAVLCGVGLWLQHPKVLFGMRWLKVKLVSVAVGIAGLHVAGRWMYMTAWEAMGKGDMAEAMAWMRKLGMVLAAGLVFVMWVVWLGRHKPRLGRRRG